LFVIACDLRHSEIHDPCLRLNLGTV
jgi:hypothetical protein